MKTIYNEGRVAGFSSYESYLRQIMSLNEQATPLDERKWLSASLSANQSMILRIPAGTRQGYHDYVLPPTSDLCGCSVIYASIFEGACTFDETGTWAIRVDDYGRLISNTYLSHPETPGLPKNVPAKEDPVNIDPAYLEQLANYLKVTGALMIQPGEWTSTVEDVELLTEGGQPIITEDLEETLLVPWNDYNQYAIFEPDLTKQGFVRIGIESDISTDLLLILTGFSYKTLVKGEVSYEQLDTHKVPEDGDFLGPAVFPWGCKIILTMTSDMIRLLSKDLQDVKEKIKFTPFWSGSRQEWNTLSEVSKAAYDYVAIQDE